jgi:L-lysine exporter family protein LysE/ArgO
MRSLFLEGLLLQASLIFALGAQNIFVLESGLRRENHLVVSFVCFLCDLTLILLGVAGAATLFTRFPHIKIFVGVLGVMFLFSYGMGKLFGDDSELKDIKEEGFKLTLKKSILLSFTFSILNPHAYLDAFILIGGFSTKYADMSDRIVLGLGAASYSGIWFLVLSTLSSVMKPILEHPGRMRVVMSCAGLVLIFLSGKLGLDVFSWIDHELSPALALNDWVVYPYAPGSMFTSILY